jgi:hypothetical protein
MRDYGAARRKSEERRDESLWRAGTGFERAVRFFNRLACRFVSLWVVASTPELLPSRLTAITIKMRMRAENRSREGDFHASAPLHWTSGGLPVGMRFAARVGDEQTLYERAYELEAALPWAARRRQTFIVEKGP